MKRTNVLLAFLLWVLFTPGANSQSAAFDKQQAYLDLSNDAVIMDISAHPDDEDGATLAYYRMKYGVKTYSVLFTRGEGGQNEKGPELYEELGVIRSMETRRAGAILGTHVVFLDFLDFGFSKTATEAFHFWGGQMEALRRLVYVIRKYKPDVLFTNHNTIDGHGHHQAVAITAIAAFDAAADPTLFPEQLKEPGVDLWQPRKLYFRAFGRMEGAADVSNQIGDTDRVRGVTYLDIATEALRQHRTQGMENVNLRAFSRGKNLYKLMRTNSLYESDSTSFLSGIDFWRDPALATLHPLRQELSTIRPGMPEDSLLSIASLCDARIDSLSKHVEGSPLANRLLAHWRECLARIVSSSYGLTVSARLVDTVVVPGQRVTCRVSAEATAGPLTAVRWSFSLPSQWSVQGEAPNDPRVQAGSNERAFTLAIGENALPTVPRVIYQYSSLDRHQNIRAILTCRIQGRLMSFTTPVEFDVAPHQTISVAAPSLVYIPGRSSGSLPLSWEVHNWDPTAVKGTVNINGLADWTSTAGHFEIPGENGTSTGTLTLRPPGGVVPGEYTFHVKTGLAETPVHVHVFRADVRPDVRVGIVESYDNTLEAATQTLNVPSTKIDDSTIAKGDLAQFSAIIVDIRAYLVRDILKSSNARLLDYVRQGGTLIVMYQRDREWKPEYAPFPFEISRRRVTREDAPITVLTPDNPLMTSPNRIGASDWLNWKQERGLYFPRNVPSEYSRLLSCADPDEEPLTTGYLCAPFGRGEYIYTSYVWYRELKEGNPGAFRCFANMISLQGEGRH